MISLHINKERDIISAYGVRKILNLTDFKKKPGTAESNSTSKRILFSRSSGQTISPRPMTVQGPSPYPIEGKNKTYL